MTDAVFKDILEIVRTPYQLSGNATAAPLGNGHINQTVLVRDGNRSLVAQRINTIVFQNPGALVHNALTIESHLEHKEEAPGIIRHLPGKDGSYLHGPDRDVRVLEYINGSRSIEVLDSPVQARELAYSFARFSRALSDLDTGRLVSVIPDFHNPSMRYRHFLDALQIATAARTTACHSEVKFVCRTEPLLDEWHSLLKSLPVRICHNDCKISNILFSELDNKVLAVIDLDTTMPGSLITDFGDMVRTCCNPEVEDSRVLERVIVRPDVFEALTEGYKKGLKGIIQAQEISSLVSGALMVCFVQGVRFLTDFLEGDRYYQVDYSLHNLDRARNQFQLFRSLQAQESELKDICLLKV